MKNIFLISIFLFAVIAIQAQSQIQTVVVGDTIFLKVTGAVGDIQWQESTDSLTWNNIIGVTLANDTIIATSSNTNKKFYRAAISDPLCPNYTWYSSIIRHKVCETTAYVKVGDLFRGGIVFKNGTYYYVNGVFTWDVFPGDGLIAFPSDYPINATWGCQGYSLPGTSDLNNGNSNTNNVVFYCGEYTASYYASNFASEGYNDWYLPSSNEFSSLGYQRDSVGGFQDWGYYWTSTQVDNNNAKGVILINSGQTQSWQKGINAKIRCIRAFYANDNLKHCFSSAIVSENPLTVNVLDQPLEQVKCLGSDVTFSISATGTTPFSYQWKKDNQVIDGEIQANLDLSNLSLNDDGLYSCNISNLCRTISTNQAHLKVIDIALATSNDTLVCKGSNASISVNAISNYPAQSGDFTYVWTPTSDLNTNNLAAVTVNANEPNIYNVVVTDQFLHCSATASVTVNVHEPYQNQKLCLVSVDPESGKNKIMYEKTFGVGNQSYVLYKETSTTNVYDILVTLEASQDGEFIDYFSQPEVHGDKYRMSIIDTCNNQSELSPYHKTVNLIIASAGSTMGLSWDDYIDESGEFTPFRYYIYRGTNPLNLTLYDSVPGSLNSYNDINVFDVYYYMVGVKKEGGCNTTATDLSFSNKIDNGNLVGINANLFANGTIQVAPNPMTNEAMLIIPNCKFSLSDYKLSIIDITGKLVHSESISSSHNSELTSGSLQIKINRGDLKSGIYFIELKADRLYRTKLIIE